MKKGFRTAISKNIIGWLILLPSVLLFTFFIWQPILYGIKLSFSNTVGFTTAGFAGLQNYKDVISDPTFVQALKNSVTYTIWSIIIGYLIPIVIAIILNEMVNLKSFFRFSIYFPNMIPGMANLLIWGILFEAGPQGFLNAIIGKFGMSPSQWLSDPKLTIPLLIIIMTWKSFGATALIYTASLQNINQELYEAASLDGAGIFARVKYITVPGIYNIARLLLIMQIISVFQVFYEPMVMTYGGPNNASVSLMLLSYNYAFQGSAMGGMARSSAVSVIVCLILITLTGIYLKVSKANEDN
jgi:multiple sugar transport system permease protein